MQRGEAVHLLDDCLGRIRRIQSSRRTSRAQTARSGISLSPLALTVLTELHYRGPARVQTLAERTDVEQTRMSREIGALHRTGHVEVSADRFDKRARVVTLTSFGAQQWATHRNAARVLIDELLIGWDDESIIVFAELFDRFLNAPQLAPMSPASAASRRTSSTRRGRV